MTLLDDRILDVFGWPVKVGQTGEERYFGRKHLSRNILNSVKSELGNGQGISVINQM